jgi:transposase
VGNVLKMDKRQQIESLHKLGYGIRAIHRMTGIHRKTISRWIVSGSEPLPVASDESAQQPTWCSDHQPEDPPPQSKSSVEPYRTEITEKFSEGMSAQRIYQDLVEEHSFIGGYDAVRRFVQKLKTTVPKYYARLVHTPGEEAQVDFGTGAPVLKEGKYRRCWLFKMTLSFSGHSYEELVWKQDVETFIRCHERAFQFFGGVPTSIKLDNLKSGVLHASLYDPELNPVYLAFASHWGFAANPCPPYRPEHKGKVERMWATRKITL